MVLSQARDRIKVRVANPKDESSDKLDIQALCVCVENLDNLVQGLMQYVDHIAEVYGIPVEKN